MQNQDAAAIRGFLDGVNKLAAIEPNLFEAAIAYTRAINKTPGATLELGEDFVIRVRMPSGELLQPGFDPTAFMVERMGEAPSASLN